MGRGAPVALQGKPRSTGRAGNCCGSCRLNESLQRLRGGCHAPSHIPGRKPLLASRPDRWTRASLVNRSGHSNSFGDHVDRPRLRLRGIADPIANGTAAPPGHRASRGGAGRGKKFMPARVCGRAPSITKIERRRSANLLRMPTGLMCKLIQRGRGSGGRPAGSRGIDASLQPHPCGGRWPVTRAVTLLPIRAQKKAIDDHGGSRFAPDQVGYPRPPSNVYPFQVMAIL